MPYQAIAPNHAAFGTEQDAYLKSLLTPTDNPGADALNRINLALQAKNTPDGYLQALREANASQERFGAAENSRDVAQSYLANLAPILKQGAGRGISLPGNGYLQTDPSVMRTADAQALQAMQAEGVKNTGAGVKDLAEAGFAPSAGYIGGMITPPAQDTPAPVSDYLSPGNKAKLEEAAAAKEQASAATIRAVKNHEGANSPKDVTTYVIDPKTGNRTPISVVSTTKPDAGGVTEKAVPKHIIDPVSHKVVPNPAYKGP